MVIREIAEKAKRNELRSIKMASGQLILPFSHIPVTTGVDPGECEYAFILHSENSDKYHIPYFVFFHDQRYPTNEYCEEVYNQCRMIYERFDQLRALEIPLDGAYDQITDSALKLFFEAPRFDLYRVQTEQEVRKRQKNNPKYSPPNNVIILQEL